MTGFRILVVDDESNSLEAIVDLLRRDDHEVHAAASTEEAEARLRAEPYDLVITDLVMPGRSGLELIRIVREQLPEASVLILTGHADFQTAVSALKAGAVDYLTKPVDPGQLQAVVAKVRRGALKAGHVPVDERDDVMEHDGLLSRSNAMRAIFEKIGLASRIEAAVLIRGESGTGKESCARSIHAGSARSHGPFVALHVASISQDRIAEALFGRHLGDDADVDGRVDHARGGTIFLDEIDALDPPSQVELLRLLDGNRVVAGDDGRARPSDVRLIAATGRDLLALVRAGSFREELYYRLEVFPIDLPPLRERRDDIPLLVSTFLERFSARYKKTIPVVAAETLSLLVRYPWPGNVRELRNVIEHAVILGTGGQLTPELLPRMIHRDDADLSSIRVTIGTKMKEVERTVIARTLDAYGWNKNKTAKILGISRRSLYNKLERYQISRSGGNAAVGFGALLRPPGQAGRSPEIAEPFPATADADT